MSAKVRRAGRRAAAPYLAFAAAAIAAPARLSSQQAAPVPDAPAAATVQVGTPAVFTACYVPISGTLYRIATADTRQDCISPRHVRLQWTDGAGGGSAAGPAGGDLVGTFPGPTVAALRGRPLADVAPTDKQVLAWNAATSRWEPTAPATGGVTVHAQLAGRDADDHTQYLLGSGVRASAIGFAVTSPFEPGAQPPLTEAVTTNALLWHGPKGALRFGSNATQGAWSNLNVGVRSFAFGSNTTASGQSSVAGGSNSRATALLSFAFGGSAEASGQSAIAMGPNAKATGESSVALGAANASGNDAVALGGSVAEGANSFAAVRGTTRANQSIAMGVNAIASEVGAFAVNGGLAEANGAMAIGTGSTASGGRSVALSGGIASGANSFAFLGTASGFASTAIGVSAVASGNGSIALSGISTVGPTATASGSSALAMMGGTADGNSSIAIGAQARTNQRAGVFVLAPSEGQAPEVAASASSQFTARFSGGYRFFTNIGLTNGCTLAPGGGQWACTSDSTTKTRIGTIDGDAILGSLRTLPIGTWEYRTEPGARHLGPMAQDFRRAFGLGADERSIAVLDASGVALAAAQALDARTRTLLDANARLRAENEALRAQTGALADRLARLEAAVAAMAAQRDERR